MEKLRKLPGMRDLPEETWLTLRRAQDRLRDLFSYRDYQFFDTPILEPTELFLRKSGGEMATQMYSFADPGGNLVSLRPEFTSSIVRSGLEGDKEPLLPIRVQYAGPVFRYDAKGHGYRQFTQVGVELIGSAQTRADSEILALACQGLAALGLSGARLVLGDVGVYNQLLKDQGLSERARVFVLSHLGELSKGSQGLLNVRRRAQQLGVLSTEPHLPSVPVEIKDTEEAQARRLIQGLLQQEELGPQGQRQAEEVVERLLRKLRGADDPLKVERALELATQLATIKGEPQDALQRAQQLLRSNGTEPFALDRLKEVVKLLSCEEMRETSFIIDFGLARGIAYYTGIIFELMHPESKYSLGGGGRYDGLTRALGCEEELPALGFAYSLEQLLETIEVIPSAQQVSQNHSPTLVIPIDSEAYGEALTVAAELRSKGTRVEMEVCGRSAEEGISYARAKGIAYVITVAGNGGKTTHRVGA